MIQIIADNDRPAPFKIQKHNTHINSSSDQAEKNSFS